MSLNGKVALITGGSRGIGAATALKLAELGAHVAITYSRSAERAQQVVQKITALGRNAEAIKADNSKPEEMKGLVSRVKDKFGRIDILVNNAGTFSPAPLDTEGLLDVYDREMLVNVRAVLQLSQEAAAVLPEGGRIINVGSVLGQRVPFPNLAVYSTSKFAVHGLTRALARDLGPKGINVNVVQPGPIDTELNPDEGEFAEILKANIIQRRYGKPEEVAGAIAFLAGPDATHITGAVINVDGGFEA